jgi:oligopeptidase A
MFVELNLAKDICHQLDWQKIHPQKTYELLLELIKIERKTFLDQLGSKGSFESFITKNALRESYINQIWSMYSHINSVKFDKEWQTYYALALEAMDNFYLEQVLNKEYFLVINSLLENETDKNKKRVLELIKKNQLLSGVNLDAERKSRYVDLNNKLSNLSEKIRTNILLSTDSWSYKVENKADLDGLDVDFVDSCKVGDAWVFDLRESNYINILENLTSSAIRKDFFQAYKTRASDLWSDKSLDNSSNLLDILQFRQEKARLLGYDNYIELALETRCVESKDQIFELLADISKKTEKKALQEFADIESFAREKFEIQEVYPWDIAFLCEKFQAQQAGFSSKDYKKYFPLDRVLDGLKTIVSKLFNVEITEIKLPVWHKDVFCWQIVDLDNDVQACCYLDLFARSGKQSGAWMDDCRTRLKVEDKLQHPVAFLNCNFSANVSGQVTINHYDVVTLFHEFGHVLNHCLSSINLPYVAGISNIEWDAVEVASQLLERWCWTKEGLDLISHHKDTGSVLPDDMLLELKKSQKLLSATQMMRQLTFGEFDFAMHGTKVPKNYIEIYDIYMQIARANNKVPIWDNDRMPAAFGHIFAGGYASGYYSYLFSEIMAADIFTVFKQNGVLDQATGQRFKRAFLSQGAIKPALDLFKDFMHRAPVADALLFEKGIL